MISIRMRASMNEMHISGAEGIYHASDRVKIVEEYINRAVTHARGEADRVVITIERIKGRPKMIRALPVTTLRCGSTDEAARHVSRLLRAAGVSARAVANSLAVIRGLNALRGAAIISAVSGKRLDRDRTRGVRASRLGITAIAQEELSVRLSEHGLDTVTVKEALVLASKVAACGQVTAELCASDDPDYSTGYVSSRRFGYVRIPHIKKRGSKSGGRVFFVTEDSDVGSVTEFLEGKAVMINRVSECRGSRSIDEILDNRHR